MMLSVLTVIYSWPFLVGVVVGLICERLARVLRCKWLTAHRPLPDGGRYDCGAIDRTWVAIAAGLIGLGYVLLQTSLTEQRYTTLAHELVSCQAINTENDRLSRQQRDLLLERGEADTAWLTRLVRPPDPTIAALPQNDPRRQAWATGITNVHNEEQAARNRQIRAISERQRALEVDRSKNPSCLGDLEREAK